MHYVGLFLLLSVASLALGALLAALVLLPFRGAARIAGRPPAVRARALLALRFIPIGAGLLAAGSVASAFIRYEPRQTTEQAGAVLMGLAVWAAMLILAAMLRLGRSALRTARCHRLLRRIGRPITLPALDARVWRVETAFPVAAVSGIFRRRLILAGRLIDECPPDELVAILRHELAHIRRRDNLMRAVFVALPDPLGALRRSGTLERAWQEAVEEAADDDATGAAPAARLALASALIRVGRMVSGRAPDWMPALALFHGDDLERRVRRLVEPAVETRSATRSGYAAITAMVAALAVLAVAVGTRPLHGLLEWAVRNLP